MCGGAGCSRARPGLRQTVRFRARDHWERVAGPNPTPAVRARGAPSAPAGGHAHPGSGQRRELNREGACAMKWMRVALIAALVGVGSAGFAADQPATDSGTPAADATPDKGAYTLWKPTPRDLMRDMDTDRPNKTNTPHTVDAGQLQLETGLADYLYFRDQSNGADARMQAWSVEQFNLRLGVLNTLEVNAGVTSYAFQRFHDNDPGTRPSPPRGPLAPSALAALLPPPEAIDPTRPPGLRNAHGAAPSRSGDAHGGPGRRRVPTECRQSPGLASPRASSDLLGSVSARRLLHPRRGDTRPGDAGAALPTQGITDALGGGGN